MIRVVEVDVGNEGGGKPRGFMREARAVEPLGSVEAGELRQEAEREIVPQPEPLPSRQVFDEIFGAKIEGGSHVEPDAGVAVLHENLIAADLANASIEREVRHGCSLSPGESV